MIVIAYEDIGLANPQAGPRALAAVQAAERLGFPEARIPLSCRDYRIMSITKIKYCL